MALRYTIIDNTTGTTTVVDEPVGFDGVTLHLGRDKDWHGFIDAINDTLSKMQFYTGQGYEILTTALADFGIDADVRLKIEYACNDNTTYDTLFEGRFNFAKCKTVTGLNGCYIEIGIDNGQWLKWLSNRAGHDIALDSRQTFDEFEADGTTPYPALTPYPGLDVSIVLPPKTIKQTDYAVYNYVPQIYDHA